MREPDALDGARVLALGLAAYAASGLLRGALPAEALGGALQLAFLAAPLLYARGAGLPPLAASGFARIRPLALVLVALASLASLWLLKVLFDLQDEAGRWLGLAEQLRSEEQAIRRSVESAQQKGAWVAGLLFVVASPLCEEVLFRGVLLRGFAAGFGPARAVAYSALLFGCLHWKLVQLPGLVLLGAYFGLVVLLTGSLWAGITAHAINNLAVLASVGLWGERVKEMRAPAWLLVLSAALFALSVAALDRLRRQGAGGPGG
jgi:membrane protease YdiL (CAAX protease family)